MTFSPLFTHQEKKIYSAINLKPSLVFSFLLPPIASFFSSFSPPLPRAAIAVRFLGRRSSLLLLFLLSLSQPSHLANSRFPLFSHLPPLGAQTAHNKQRENAGRREGKKGAAALKSALTCNPLLHYERVPLYRHYQTRHFPQLPECISSSELG